MFRKLMPTSSPECRVQASVEEQIEAPAKPPALGIGERNRNDSSENAKLSSFEEIYCKASFRAATSTAAWDILKVADMIGSEHLQGLSPAGKHSAIMMALEAAGVAVEDMLQDAVQRQRVLNEYEDTQRHRLEEFEKVKAAETSRLAEEMEGIRSKYQMRIATARDEIDRERSVFREWQERKDREQRRISEAASACVAGDSVESDASISRMLEKRSGRLRELA